ncbi:MAG: hypothetical protein QM820_00560 [Minicystis sp.]
MAAVASSAAAARSARISVSDPAVRPPSPGRGRGTPRDLPVTIAPVSDTSATRLPPRAGARGVRKRRAAGSGR